MQPCRLIFDEPASGPWNMAVDEALLDTAANAGVGTLRFYRWSEPTLSLGYFQAYADRDAHAESRSLPAVRRRTGGGALVHDRELTYALALPANHPKAGDPTTLTCLAHRALIAALAEVGVETEGLTTCAVAIPPPDQGEPFLCFERRARGDLLATAGAKPAPTVDGLHKIGGSAQRRRRGAVLQHGGVLVSRSIHAPELLGVEQLCAGYGDSAGRLAGAWSGVIADEIGAQLEPGTLKRAERESAEQLAQQRFSSIEWTRKR